MISQLTIFLPNEQGTLSDVSHVLAEAEINMHALVVADTADYGIIRIICDTPQKAASSLTDAGRRATITPVIGIHLDNTPGSLAKLLDFCDQEGMNIQYGYCFLINGEAAVDVLKIDDSDAEAKLAEGGFSVVHPEEIYEP